jgi:hypothetical protein
VEIKKGQEGRKGRERRREKEGTMNGKTRTNL